MEKIKNNRKCPTLSLFSALPQTILAKFKTGEKLKGQELAKYQQHLACTTLHGQVGLSTVASYRFN